MTKRVHSDLIHRWADDKDAVVQYKSKGSGEWLADDNPNFNPDYEWRVSLTKVEGKPVFEGDVLYNKFTGHNFRATKFQIDMEGWWDQWSWTPPKPKTVTVELLREDAEKWLNTPCINRDALFRMEDAVKKALK